MTYCARCGGQNADASVRCYHCGAGLPRTVPLSEVAQAFHDFTRTPLLLVATIIYSIYATIVFFEGIPNLQYIGDSFQLMGIEFLLGVATLASLFLFIAPLITAIGLWRMYATKGAFGASAVCSGIVLHVTLTSVVLGCVYLTLWSNEGAMRVLSEHDGNWILPLILGIFQLFVVGKMHRFAKAVDNSAGSNSPDTYSLKTTAILAFIGAFIDLLLLTDVFDLYNVMDMTGVETGLVTLTSLLHIITLILFGIGALYFESTMTQAELVYLHNRPAPAPYTPRPAVPAYTPRPAVPAYTPRPAVPNPVAPKPTAASMVEADKIAALKQYKELLDAGVITQEEFEAKKQTLLK